MTSSSLPLAWMTHMASMVMHKCVTQALARSVDPRAHLNEINWEVMSERLLSGEDIKMLWYYIRKEVRALHQAGLLQGAAYLFSYSNFSSPSSSFFPSSSLLSLLLSPSSPPPSLLLLTSLLPLFLPSSPPSASSFPILYFSVSRQYSPARNCGLPVTLCQTDCRPVCARRHQVKSEVHSVKCTVYVN